MVMMMMRMIFPYKKTALFKYATAKNSKFTSNNIDQQNIETKYDGRNFQENIEDVKLVQFFYFLFFIRL